MPAHGLTNLTIRNETSKRLHLLLENYNKINSTNISLAYTVMKSEITRLLVEVEDMCKLFSQVMNPACKLLNAHVPKLQELLEKIEPLTFEGH